MLFEVGIPNLMCGSWDRVVLHTFYLDIDF